MTESNDPERDGVEQCRIYPDDDADQRLIRTLKQQIHTLEDTLAAKERRIETLETKAEYWERRAEHLESELEDLSGSRGFEE